MVSCRCSAERVRPWSASTRSSSVTARSMQGAGGELAQAMRDEIAVMYDGLELDGDAMPRAGPCRAQPAAAARSSSAVSTDGRCAAAGSSAWTSGPARSRRCTSCRSCAGTGVPGACCTSSRTGPAGWATGRPAGHRPQAGQRPRAVRVRGLLEIEDFNGNPVAYFWGEKPLALRGSRSRSCRRPGSGRPGAGAGRGRS